MPEFELDGIPIAVYPVLVMSIIYFYEERKTSMNFIKLELKYMYILQTQNQMHIFFPLGAYAP